MDNIIQTIASVIKFLINTSNEMSAAGASNSEITFKLKMPSGAETSNPEATCTLKVTMPEEPTALLKCWNQGFAASQKLEPFAEQGVESTCYELFRILNLQVKLQSPSGISSSN